MYSWVAKTEEIDMLDEAVDELSEQINKMDLKKNTVGIAYVYFDTDFEELAKLINEKISFPVVGVSTLALLDNDGYSDYGIKLLVLSDDETEFETGITEEATIDSYSEEITKTYSEMTSKKPDKEVKLVLTYICKLLGHNGDNHIKVINELCGGVPIFGGMASDLFQYNRFKIFSNGYVRTQGVAFVMMYGNVKPITIAESSVSNIRTIGGKITKAEGNKIYTLDDKPFMEVLKDENLCTDDEYGYVGMDFMQTPFIIEKSIESGEKVEVLRNLIYIEEDGSGNFLGDVSQDTVIKVSSLRPEDIGSSVNHAFENLLSRIDESRDYKYSTVICTSCTGRYINLVGEKDVEGRAYKDILPDEISLVGMYSYGEICPQKNKSTGNYYNSFHNETFTILAF